MVEADPFDIGKFAQLPAGALRILSRHGGTEILILHGDGRDTANGERLAHVSWWPSLDVAAALSGYCSHLLLAARYMPDADGWHRFHEEHIKTLVANARTHLNVTLYPPDVPSRQAWTLERVARLAFLAGQGWTAQKIADDELIRSTANNVYRQAHRFGIYLSEAPQGQISFQLPLETIAVIDKAAAVMNQQRNLFLRRFLIRSAAQRTFFEQA